MASLMEIMQLCRLCLVKDQVNIPIFEEQGDIRQIFLKISACLPVKVSREDNLPKKICDGCSYKLEILYQFWNTSANSEKQLLKWLSQVGAEKSPTSDKVAVAPVQPHSMPSDGVILKQEVVDLADSHSADEIAPDDLNVSSDAQDYILQQQQLPYQPIAFQFPQDGFAEGEGATNASGPSATVTSEAAEAAPPKRKRRAAAMKALPPQIDSEEEDEDDVDMVETKIAKTEEQTDESGGEDPEPTAFVGVPSTSTDNEQPGPSGVGKGSAEAPYTEFLMLHDTLIFENPLDIQIKTEGNELQKSIKDCFLQAFSQPFSVLTTPDNLTNILQNRVNPLLQSLLNTSIVKIKQEPPAIDESIVKQEVEEMEQPAEHNIKKPVKRKKFNYRKVQNKAIVEKALYYCHVCKDNKKITRSQLREHLQRHGFPGADDLSEDFFRKACARKNRSKLPPYHRCEICSEHFTNKRELDAHMDTHEDQFFCDVCNKGFKKLIDHAVHMQIHSEDKLFRCPLCDTTADKACYIRAHLYAQHEQFRKYKCDICNKGFSIYSYYEEHKNYHTGEKPFQCDVCGLSFMYLRYLNTHKTQRHSEASQKGIECSVCKKTFANKKSYNSHTKKHSGDSYVCDICGKKFNTKAALATHRPLHIEDKPFKCKYCEKGFKKSKYRIDHERTHTGEKPHKCPHCNKSFSQRSSMVRHTYCHTGKKPFTCHICKKGFVSKFVLSKHFQSGCQGAVSSSDEPDSE